jgi:transposase
MGGITTVGLDLAKNVFQVHGVDGAGSIIVRRRLRRADVLPFFEQLPGCLVGLEACASAHYWTRAIAALGHAVKLMPPAYVKQYMKRGKADAADAEAICEAATRPMMRFVATKTEEQQATPMLHKTRDLLVRRRTMLTNALRAHLAEYGIVSAQGVGGIGSVITALHEDQATLPMLARLALHGLVAQLRSIEAEIQNDRGAKSSTGLEATKRAGGWRPSPVSVRSR